jgi:hypothetical protein
MPATHELNAIIGKVWVEYEPHPPPSSLYADCMCGLYIPALREPNLHTNLATALLLLKTTENKSLRMICHQL